MSGFVSDSATNDVFVSEKPLDTRRYARGAYVRIGVKMDQTSGDSADVVITGSRSRPAPDGDTPEADSALQSPVLLSEVMNRLASGGGRVESVVQASDVGRPSRRAAIIDAVNSYDERDDSLSWSSDVVWWGDHLVDPVGPER